MSAMLVFKPWYSRQIRDGECVMYVMVFNTRLVATTAATCEDSLAVSQDSQRGNFKW